MTITFSAAFESIEILITPELQVFMAWIIAPLLAGVFAATIFTTTKYLVLLRKDPVMRGLFFVPIYFSITGGLVVMLLTSKGGEASNSLNGQQLIGVILGVGAAIGIIVAVFFVPWLYRTIVRQDWQLRWYDIIKGPLLLKRGEVPPMPSDYRGRVRDYYAGHATRDDIESRPGSQADIDYEKELPLRPEEKTSLVGDKPDGLWYSGPVLFWYLKWALFRGVDKDVISAQSGGDALSGDIRDMHSRAAKYDNKAEYLHSFLQILTAATASFTHGANDVAK
jgi:solute carrier family 20 (sodium-dependent phosphate transporter)